MLEFAIAVIRAGFRSRAFQAVFALGVVLVGVAFLAASFSPRQPQTVALDVGISGMRFSLVLLALFWVQDFLGREVDRKTALYSLSYPVSRGSYLAGRFCGIVILLAAATLLLGALLQLAVGFAGGDYVQDHPPEMGWSYWATLAGLWLGVVVVTAVTFLMAALSTVSFLPFAVGAAFAVAAQSLGAVADYLASGADGQDALVARYAPLVAVIRWILPDLSRLDWRTWPLYGLQPEPSVLMLSVAMGFAYVVLMFALAVRVFAKRDFT